jgi:glycosyltransferase involved in cell wall biosynthesis
MDALDCVSVVMPVFNEENTVGIVVDRVLARSEVREVIIVDDGSTDTTGDLIATLARDSPRIRFIRHATNKGKGAAIRSGIKLSTAPILLIQDADLEYNPDDYPRLIQPIVTGKADVVYGSRFRSGEACRVLYFWHSIGNRFLTLLSNMMTDLNLTDMETCYKVFRTEFLAGIILCEDRFGFEPEITAKIARRRARVYEVAISYDGRTYEEGKKIGWRDGLRAVWCILRYNLLAVEQ